MSAVVPAAAPLFSRSLTLIQAWIAELAPPKPAAPQQPAVAAAKPVAATEAKPAKAPKANSAPAAEATSMSKVALICGKVLEVAPHPDSDKLYVEKIDLGEAQPRTIISGLRDYITVEQFTGRTVVVVANLEPRKMRGIESAGMVLCASTEGKGDVKLLDVPAGVPPGERIVFPGHDGNAEPVLKKKLVKHWEDVAPLLKTDATGVAKFGDLPFVTSCGPVTSPIPNGTVS
jgi:methionine--tRNA ligase beta chain